MVKASIIENILFKNENMLPYDQEYNQISAVGLGLDGSQLLFDFAGPYHGGLSMPQGKFKMSTE